MENVTVFFQVRLPFVRKLLLKLNVKNRLNSSTTHLKRGPDLFNIEQFQKAFAQICRRDCVLPLVIYRNFCDEACFWFHKHVTF